jgi:hypothetical protein
MAPKQTSQVTKEQSMVVQETMGDAHRATVRAPIGQITGFLQEIFGQRLVAYMAGIDNEKTVGRWAKGAQAPRLEAEQRLRAAHLIASTLIRSESEHVIRAWFIGANPQLSFKAPAAAIREGRYQETATAMHAYLSGG